MQSYIERVKTLAIIKRLKDSPVVAILGPRQCGKSTLAKSILSNINNSIFLDLEKESDINKINDPELFFAHNKGKLICLDEIQRLPEIFQNIRVFADEQKNNGQFLILGSASYELLQQSSETLAGRISYIELSPFLFQELKNKPHPLNDPSFLWMRGGFPRSILASSEESSLEWRNNFIRTFLERNIAGLGIKIPSNNLNRFWRMFAHVSGQVLNKSKLAASLGVSAHTVSSYIDVLSHTYMLRILEPYTTNEKKRLIKSPKVYIRDTGILHALLDIKNMNELLAHPIFGQSWESFVIEQIISALPHARFSYYRNSDGNEIDLIFRHNNLTYAVECKASSAPSINKGFYVAAKAVKADHCWIIAPVEQSYPYDKQITIGSPAHLINSL